MVHPARRDTGDCPRKATFEANGGKPGTRRRFGFLFCEWQINSLLFRTDASHGPIPEATAATPDRSGDRRLRIAAAFVEAEQSVIGGLLLDNTAYDKISDLIFGYRFLPRRASPHLPRRTAHAGTRQAGRCGDRLRWKRSMPPARPNTPADWPIWGTGADTPSAANIRRYGEIVRGAPSCANWSPPATRSPPARWNPLGRGRRRCFDEAEARSCHRRIRDAPPDRLPDINPLLTQVVERIQELHDRDNPSDITGIPTGYNDLDKMTSGPAGRSWSSWPAGPSMGKTSFG